MRKLLQLLPMFAIAVVAVTLIGCENTNTEEPKPEPPTPSGEPVIKLEQSSMDINAEGGSFAIGYTIESALDGVNLLPQCEDSWINNIVITTANVTFSVDPNSGSEERTGTIHLKYPGVDTPATITITQACFEGDMLSITISDITSSSFVANIVCLDESMYYVVFVSSISYLEQMGIETEEALFEDDKSYFTALAEQYNVNLGQFMILNNVCMTGNNNVRWPGLSPADTYVAYAYGIKFNEDTSDYVQATPMVYAIAQPERAKLAEYQFNISYEINGPEVTHIIEPVDWDGAYYYEYFAEGDPYHYPEDQPITDEYIQSVVNDWLSFATIYMNAGYSAEEFTDMACHYGRHSFSNTLLAGTKYMAQAYAIDIIDGIPQVVSKPNVVYFTTDDVELSDMDIALSVENVYARVADVTITPTNNNDPYTILVVNTEDIVGTTNQEILDWAVNTFKIDLYQGEVIAHLNTLQPDTDYAMLAFGYYGGKITTELFRLDFSTEAAAKGENEVLNITTIGPYSPRALAEYDPHNYGHIGMYDDYGYIAFWAEIEVKTPTPDLFYHLYTLDNTMYGDEYLANDLMSYGSIGYEALFTAREDVTFMMCGIAMDYRGNISKVYYGEPFSFNSANNRPIEELIEKIESTQTRSGQLMLGAPDGSVREVSRSYRMTNPAKRESSSMQEINTAAEHSPTMTQKGGIYKGFFPVK